MSSLADLLSSATSRTHKSTGTNKYDKNIQILPINDQRHLENHLNYLFRTDPNQKWTNELTPQNTYIIGSHTNEDLYKGAWTKTEDIAGRNGLKKLVKGLIRYRAEDAHKFGDAYARELCQIRVDYIDSSAYSITPLIQSHTTDLLAEVSAQIEGFDLLCLVVHVDQKDCYLHTHLLFHMP